MKKYRYIWPWHTMVPKVKWWESYKVTKWEVISSELDTQYMLQNEFRLLGMEVEELNREYISKVNSLEVRKTGAEHNKDLEIKELKSKISVIETWCKAIATECDHILEKTTEEYRQNLEELVSDEDKDVSGAAQIALKELWVTVKVEDNTEKNKLIEEAKALGINAQPNRKLETIKQKIAEAK